MVYRGWVEVFNSSALPIYAAKVPFPVDETGYVIEVGFVPGGQTGHEHRVPAQAGTSLEGESLAVAFRDADGRWWSRGVGGHLHRHDADPWPRKQP